MLMHSLYIAGALAPNGSFMISILCSSLIWFAKVSSMLWHCLQASSWGGGAAQKRLSKGS